MFSQISAQASRLVSLTKRSQKGSKTKVVAISSGKGGVGKSTLTANMAYLLSNKGFKVAVLDADIGLANLQVLFDIKPTQTFFDYLEGDATLENILLKTQYPNVTLIAGKSGYEFASLNNCIVFSRVVEDIVSLNRFDILLVDTGAGINEHVQDFLEVTDNIVAVTTTDPSALTDVYALIKMISEKKEKLMLCFNSTLKYETGEAITKSIVNLAIKNKLNRNFMVKYVGNIEESKSISSTGRLRKLFVKEFSGEIASKQLRLVLDNIVNNLR